MKKQTLFPIAAILALAAAIFTTGCEVNVNAQDASANPPPTTTPPPTTPPATNAPPTTPPATNAPPVYSVDELDISSAKNLGEHADIKAQEAAITRDLYSANKQGDNVKLSFETLGWSTKTGSNGKTIDGSVHIFWISGGRVVGGMFDWHGQGQTTKTLGNLYHNYLGGVPAAGQEIYFCLVSLDEKQRTNVVKSDTPW